MLIKNLDYLNLVNQQLLIKGSGAFTSANTFTWSGQSTAKANAVAIGSQTFTATNTYAKTYSDSYVFAGDAGAYGVAHSRTRLNIDLSVSVDASTTVSFKH